MFMLKNVMNYKTNSQIFMNFTNLNMKSSIARKKIMWPCTHFLVIREKTTHDELCIIRVLSNHIFWTIFKMQLLPTITYNML